MLNAVKNNSIDAIFTPTTNNPDGLKLIAKGGKLDYYCAVKKGNTNLLTKLNSAINQYKIQNPFYLSMEYTKLFKRPYSNSIGYTKEEQTAKEITLNFAYLRPTTIIRHHIMTRTRANITVYTKILSKKLPTMPVLKLNLSRTINPKCQ